MYNIISNYFKGSNFVDKRYFSSILFICNLCILENYSFNDSFELAQMRYHGNSDYFYLDRNFIKKHYLNIKKIYEVETLCY